ncbi:hypothetical protein TWF506_004472 [Arthrobotrys conoides]|uniref:Carboxylic ester hydrolase n=1 Tax=Arthrobotrys conoides TaxID=74498 RepID=A0AAN8RPD3_9PEZI
MQLSILVGTILVGLSASAHGASLTTVTGWGSNPAGIQMNIYVPDTLPANPAIILALHQCGGSGQQFYGVTSLPYWANQYGYILIFPSSNGYCWDNHSPQSLTRNGGGDTQSLAQQVQYALTTYNGDPNRVYAFGWSSGGSMVNNLAATYPELFEAGATYGGTPAGCFAGAGSSTQFQPTTNTTCASGGIIKTPQEWGDFARNAYPGGYTGRRPRLQITNGALDTIISPQNHQEQLKQWSNVLGLSLTATNPNTPGQGYTQSVYGTGNKLVGYLISGVDHLTPFWESRLLAFFGIP